MTKCGSTVARTGVSERSLAAPPVRLAKRLGFCKAVWRADAPPRPLSRDHASPIARGPTTLAKTWRRVSSVITARAVWEACRTVWNRPATMRSTMLPLPLRALVVRSARRSPPARRAAGTTGRCRIDCVTRQMAK